jgi:hypothetical protein
MKPDLTLDILRLEAKKFADIETKYDEPTLYGVTDGKALSTSSPPIWPITIPMKEVIQRQASTCQA